MTYDTIVNRPCRACGHMWMAHRRTRTGACETCQCKAFHDSLRVPPLRVRGSARSGGATP